MGPSVRTYIRTMGLYSRVCHCECCHHFITHGCGRSLADFACYVPWFQSMYVYAHCGAVCYTCTYCIWHGSVLSYLSVSCDCHMTLLFCCQDYPSVGLVGRLLLQENVIPIFMITQNDQVTGTYNVGTLPSISPSTAHTVCIH